LTEVLAGSGQELTRREGQIPLPLETAFHGDEEPHTFIMQKEFSVREPDLFRHPEATAWLRELARRLVAIVDEGMEEDDIVYDLAREGDFMGAFSVLCLLGLEIVDRSHFAHWRARVHTVMDEQEPTGDEMEDRFTEKYYSLLDIAFDYVLDTSDGKPA
jgi:hypothetical protein